TSPCLHLASTAPCRPRTPHPRAVSLPVYAAGCCYTAPAGSRSSRLATTPSSSALNRSSASCLPTRPPGHGCSAYQIRYIGTALSSHTIAPTRAPSAGVGRGPSLGSHQGPATDHLLETIRVFPSESWNS